MCRIRFYTNALYRMKSNQIYLSANAFHSSAPSGQTPHILFSRMNCVRVCARSRNNVN